MEFDSDLRIPDRTLSINQGAITVLGWQSCQQPGSFANAILQALAKEYHFDLDTPFGEYRRKFRIFCCMEPEEKRFWSTMKDSAARDSIRLRSRA